MTEKRRENHTHGGGGGHHHHHHRPHEGRPATRAAAAATSAAADAARAKGPPAARAAAAAAAAAARLAAARLADAAASRLDTAFAAAPAALGLAPRFFAEGWGDLGVVNLGGDALLAASATVEAAGAARADPRAWRGPAAAAIPALAPDWKRVRAEPGLPPGTSLFEAAFPTPAAGRVRDALPPESRTARAWLVVGDGADPAGGACVVHLAGTGDHGRRRRLNLAAPLAPAASGGVAALILESPFYGGRRPPGQHGAKLRRVSDLLTLGRATIEEALALLAHASGGLGYARLGVAGLSMGGVHAGMVAGLAPGPLGCAALLAPRSAAAAFCDGALWPATAWEPLTSPADGARRDVLATVLAAAGGGGAARAADRVLAAVAAGEWPLGRAEGGEGGGGGGASAAVRAAAAAAGGAAVAAAAPAASSSSAANAAATAGSAAADAAAGGRAGGIDAADGALAGLRAASVAAGGGGGAPVGAARRAHDDRDNHSHHHHHLGRHAARRALATVLETYTDVTRLPPPALPAAAILVGARADRYVAATSVEELAAHWPGAEVRWVPGGHVSAFLTQAPAFRQAIRDSVARVPPLVEGGGGGPPVVGGGGGGGEAKH